MKKRNGVKKGKTKFAKKSLGQNFLTDLIYIDKIVSGLNPQQNDTIVEIGPGRGALTQSIVRRAGKVIAIEIDRELIPVLRKRFETADNFVLIENDALEIDFGALLNLQSRPSNTKLVANLPYYISTAILQHLIQYRSSFSEMVLMLQKEVVERITAKPGNSKRGFLTVLTEAYFDGEKLFEVPRKAFRPIPKVTSAVLRLKPKSFGRIDKYRDRLFREIVSLAFRHKRKTLANNFNDAEERLLEMFELNGGIPRVLELADIESKARAEAVSEASWTKLVNILNSSDTNSNKA